MTKLPAHGPPGPHGGQAPPEPREPREPREPSKRPGAPAAQAVPSRGGGVRAKASQAPPPAPSARPPRKAASDPRSSAPPPEEPPAGLESGARVRVTSGPFAGKTGVIKELVGRKSARVMLGLLPVQLDLDDLAPGAPSAAARSRQRLTSSHRKPIPARS